MASHYEYTSRYVDKECLVPVLRKPFVYSLLAAISALFVRWYFYTDSLVFSTVEQLITRHGYPVESHFITSQDGIGLTVHRIPHGLNKNSTGGPPVLFQHGFTASSAIWVFQGPEQDLAFILADKGFDVWLLNARGNEYSSTPWWYTEYSYHEIGLYDLPAHVDYITKLTGYTNVSLIGHSMGTTSTLVFLSLKPEYNVKINSFIALAPLANRRPFQVPAQQSLEGVYLFLGRTGFYVLDLLGVFNRNLLRSNLIHLFISPLSRLKIISIYDSVFHPFCGVSNCTVDIPGDVLLAHTIDSSTETILFHYHENFMRGAFRMRDLGPEGNLKAYNSLEPLPYNLSNVVVDITAYTGTVDTLTPIEDFENFVPAFGGKVEIKPISGFNHYDVVWANEARTELYPLVVKKLCKVNRPFITC